MFDTVPPGPRLRLPLVVALIGGVVLMHAVVLLGCGHHSSGHQPEAAGGIWISPSDEHAHGACHATAHAAVTCVALVVAGIVLALRFRPAPAGAVPLATVGHRRVRAGPVVAVPFERLGVLLT